MKPDFSKVLKELDFDLIEKVIDQLRLSLIENFGDLDASEAIVSYLLVISTSIVGFMYRNNSELHEEMVDAFLDLITDKVRFIVKTYKEKNKEQNN